MLESLILNSKLSILIDFDNIIVYESIRYEINPILI